MEIQRKPTNHSFSKFSEKEIEQSVVSRFEQMVNAWPGRIAVKSVRSEVSYGELNRAANRLAWTILGQEGNRDEPIALLLEHDTQVMIAIMGVLKAGGFYVPLEPAYPVERLSYMLTDSRAQLVITNTTHLDMAKSIADRIINLDEISLDGFFENPNVTISPDNPAYLLYTSGSTGRPKGIYNNHRNLLYQVMSYTNSVHLGPDDRHSLLQSCSFSRTLKEVFGSLLNGAAICIYDIKLDGLARLADWLMREEITLLGSAVTVYRLFVGILTGKEDFTHLRCVYLGAEPFFKRDVDLFRRHFPPECVLIHGMGATETGTFLRFSINWETRIDGNTIPAGYPLPGMDVRLVDKAGNDPGLSGEGEIAVKSRYLALGYWRQPEMTQASFQVDPNNGPERIYLTGDLGRRLDNGTIVHLGRKDFQLKVRGHRVEIAEIEGALYNIESIEQAVVAARSEESGEQRLAAYVVFRDGRSAGVDEVRRQLAGTLPEHMLPDAFFSLDAMPYTPNGKVDRRALAAVAGRSEKMPGRKDASGSAIEEALAAMWSEVLGIGPVGGHDNFFNLGGNSLSATRVIASIQKVFNVELSISHHFMENIPTISSLASVISEKQKENKLVDMTALLDEVEKIPEEQIQSLIKKQNHTE